MTTTIGYKSQYDSTVYSDHLEPTTTIIPCASTSNLLMNKSSVYSKKTKHMVKSELIRCKRKLEVAEFSHNMASASPISVARRNERERNRVKMVNMGFNTLRQHIPNGSKDKKMSKVETLRSAVAYIRQLQLILNEDSSDSQVKKSFTNQQSNNLSENLNPSILISSNVSSTPSTLNFYYSHQMSDDRNFWTNKPNFSPSSSYSNMDSNLSSTSSNEIGNTNYSFP